MLNEAGPSVYTQAVFYCEDNLVEYYEERGAQYVDTVDGKNRMRVKLRSSELLPSVDTPAQVPGDDTTEREGSEPRDLQRVRGTGSTYSERLQSVGIETLDDLAGADPALAEGIRISEDQFEQWRARARRLLDEE